MLQTGLALLAQNGGNEGATDTILWIIAAVLVVAGIVSIVRGALLWGILLIMGITFRYQLSGIAFLPFFPAERLVALVRRRAAARALGYG